MKPTLTEALMGVVAMAAFGGIVAGGILIFKGLKSLAKERAEEPATVGFEAAYTPSVRDFVPPR